ncbi:hypothetical protein PsorP6_010764 [Peronosclerospora sorghi]|uniref:Uncharacterized protein n=1 Tax=Peronosclerospora sorghi TaxID=230839 RepID=A0ACC0VVV5_9STRA|nr:hypothetical protein PsorP6_010764 [Peronosclerospora sorghi]
MMTSSSRNFDRFSSPFSDAVIGNVLTRSAAPGYRVRKPSCTPFSFASSKDSPHQERLFPSSPPSTMVLPPLRKFSASDRFQFGPPASKSHRDLHATGPSRVLASHAQSSGASFTSNTDSTVSAAVATLSIHHTGATSLHQESKKRLVSVKSKACREQCRTNQARYRQKQREYVFKLESTVAQLRDEIPMLEVQRRRLRYDSRQRVWDVVVEYFQLFRHGVGNSFELRTTDVLRTSEAQQQWMFLCSTMASDTKFGNACGVELLMEYWRQLSECHENLHFELVHMEKISESIVTATATLSVTVTKTTLECFFPHLMGSEQVEDLSLAVKLLGRRLDYPCTVVFIWDEETSLVVRVETEVDMASPILHLLGNLKDTSRVIEGAVWPQTTSTQNNMICRLQQALPSIESFSAYPCYLSRCEGKDAACFQHGRDLVDVARLLVGENDMFITQRFAKLLDSWERHLQETTDVACESEIGWSVRIGRKHVRKQLDVVNELPDGAQVRHLEMVKQIKESAIQRCGEKLPESRLGLRHEELTSARQDAADETVVL